MFKLPKLGEQLTEDQLKFIQTFAQSCRKSILEMVVNAQSGHPGGSLSSIDYLSILYTFIISQTGEKIVVSNGHISPAIYSVLAEMGYIPKDEVTKTFRKIGSIYEGHVTRHVPGVWYGTGPLGIGVSVASAFALAEKLNSMIIQRAQSASAQENLKFRSHGFQGSNLPSHKNKINEVDACSPKVFALAGDGECQEGQVHEMIHFAKQHQLNNLILSIDYNKVQLTASLKKIIDIDIAKIFHAGNWKVIEIDAHNYQEIWNTLAEAYKSNQPVAILGHSVMGQGVDFMEKTGQAHMADWHGKAPKPEQVEAVIRKLQITQDEEKILNEFRETIKWKAQKPNYPKLLSPVKINTGTPILYDSQTLTDCRSAYGKALLDLAQLNPNVIALTADLKGSVMTQGISEKLPNQYVECGIAEQNMVSVAGGFSLSKSASGEAFIPFASTFGAFMSSRAKDQARVNDINHTNVKMVATHCGLSVGEDGPTHQAIDDAGSFLGMFNTMVIEPADPNQTDRIIRYIASHYGNFYVRMGRHKFPIITKEDGAPFYDTNYKYEYGRCDVIRTGKDVTIAATGATINEALKAYAKLKTEKPEISIEIVAVTSIKKFDHPLIDSIKRTRKVITVEDHNSLSGLGGQLARFLQINNLKTEVYKMIAPTEYQFSGKAEELYHAAKIDAEEIIETVLKMI